MKKHLLKLVGLLGSACLAFGGFIPIPIPSFIIWGEIPFPKEEE